MAAELEFLDLLEAKDTIRMIVASTGSALSLLLDAEPYIRALIALGTLVFITFYAYYLWNRIRAQKKDEVRKENEEKRKQEEHEKRMRGEL